jgi:hypothetical protein
MSTLDLAGLPAHKEAFATPACAVNKDLGSDAPGLAGKAENGCR